MDSRWRTRPDGADICRWRWAIARDSHRNVWLPSPTYSGNPASSAVGSTICTFRVRVKGARERGERGEPGEPRERGEDGEEGEGEERGEREEGDARREEWEEREEEAPVCALPRLSTSSPRTGTGSHARDWF